MAAITSYADSSRWELWQTEYRYGAFSIFPPNGTIEAIDALRHTYDPRSHSFCQAHISLSDPVPQPLPDEQLCELLPAVSSVEPLELRYGPLRSFPPYPGVAYAVAPEEVFRALRAVVHATSIFGGVEVQHDSVAPHITVAEFITLERTDELLLELNGAVPEGAFLCDAIEYAVPNESFYFERILTLPLGTGGGVSPTGETREDQPAER